MIGANSMFWHEEIETLNRAELEALQLNRLRETVRRHSRAQNVRQLRLFDGSAASGEGDGKPVSEMFAAVERYRR